MRTLAWAGRRATRPASLIAVAAMAAAGAAAGCTPSTLATSLPRPLGIHKIQHVIIIMQENRSFDNYFGTYPGAMGIPMSHGVPTVCLPERRGTCVRPHHIKSDIDGGGPHGEADAVADMDHGRMDGFVTQWQAASKTCAIADDPACRHTDTPDVMGYHTGAEIPNYWAYAKNFALDDRMFEPVKSWSLPAHLFMVSGWSAKCRGRAPMSCTNDIGGPYGVNQFSMAVHRELVTGTMEIDLAWTDITWLLYARHVSWAYYVQSGYQPDCPSDSQETCRAVPQNYLTPGIWNPLPMFGDVHTDHQLGNIQDVSRYLSAAKTGHLPSVSWVVPSQADSEHPPASVHQGQAYVTALINAAMKGPEWKSTAIFLSWDDWGGFYDNVVPPQVDENGYGLRVPSLVISPYTKRGFIDSQILSSDAYLKFIEDDFLGGAAIDPETDGRPDRRPDVREELPILGNLEEDFNFSQQPRPPFLLPTNPPTDSRHIPSVFQGQPPCLGCTTLPPARQPNPFGVKGMI